MDSPGLDVAPDVLDLGPEQMRRLGHWVVDRTVDHLQTLRDRPAITERSWDDLSAVLGGAAPRGRGDVEEGLALLADVALEAQQHGDHPRYFARVPGPSSDVAILGEWLAVGMQAIASSWGGGSGTATLELVVLDWLRDALGLAPASEGIILTGGSMASTTALIVARAETGGGVVYLSDQTHSSIKRGAVTTGWDPALVRVLPTGDDLRLAPGTVRAAVEADLAAGLHPAVVVATSGTTNAGTVDDIPAIAEIAREHGLWLHVDGAYGGPAALSPERHGICGLELADSFVLDPHKWLFQPYDAACLWVARPGALDRTFAMHPEYLTDTQGGVVDLHNRGLELTRHARAAKLWLTLRTYGLDAIEDAVERGIALAEAAEALAVEAGFEITSAASLGVVTFAVPDVDDEGHSRIASDVTEHGYAAITSTVLRGRRVLRLCTINPRTTEDDLRGTIAVIASCASATRLPR
ncbi:MAG TPA: aminotransferase class I/II-fold pyridoxal phosphate-dependent enzyme [Candidatus Nanopelagicales bacterium]|nr:aminotransferase class I/II-fold pyridoxal phosphate-dependent enzyme [Candidatus Nanopelagicales bacterium]